jgi:hypothetical protein
MKQLNTGQLGGSNSAATFPLLLLILIDSMGFGILTPLLASALARDQTPRFAEASARTIAISSMDLRRAYIR